MALDIGAKSSKSGLGGAIAGGALGIVGGLINSNQQDKREQRAYENQRKLNEQGQELGVKTWKETNAPAQVEQLEKAGLSTGLMYGKGGSGGTVASPSGGSAPSPQQMDIAGHVQSGLQTALTKSTIRLQDSQANKNDVESGKTSTVDTDNAKLEGLLTKAKTITETQRSGEVMQNAIRIAEDVVRMSRENEIGEETKNDAINQIKENAIKTAIERKQKESQTKLTDKEIETFREKLLMQWAKVGVSAISPISKIK